MKILGREPAVFYTLLASAISLASGLGLHLTTDQQGAINIAVTLVAGCAIAWQVSSEKGLALLGGVAKALIALALAFGVHLPPELQSSALLLTNLLIGLVVRSQVDAPVPGPGVITGSQEYLTVPQSAGGRHEIGENT